MFIWIKMVKLTHLLVITQIFLLNYLIWTRMCFKSAPFRGSITLFSLRQHTQLKLFKILLFIWWQTASSYYTTLLVSHGDWLTIIGPLLLLEGWKEKGQSSTVDLVSVFPQQHILNYVKAYRWWTLNSGGETGDVGDRELSPSWKETKQLQTW